MKGRVAAIWICSIMLVTCITIIVDISEPVRGATTITVDDSGGADFFTITMAMNVANDGDTIYVYSGTYYEHVVVDKSINLTGEDRDTTIIDAQGVGDVVHISADWVNVSGFTLRDSGPNGNPRDAGIDIDYAHNVTISECKFTENHDAIYLNYANNSIITNNVIDDFRGLDVEYSTNITILGNSISAQYQGVDLSNSILCKISNNAMIDTGFEFSGYYLMQWNTHEIDSSNTINGKPVQYWKNQNGGTLPLGAGQVILANCTNIVVENQHIFDGYIGIILGFSYNNLIRNNNASLNHENGLYLYRSDNNTIEDNIILDSMNGIDFHSSNDNNIAGNYISENGGGMIFGGSDGNNITDNIFQYNLFGLMLVLSNRNYINNNNFSYNWASAGIHISSSSNNSIFNNMLFENKEGINITDFFYDSYYNRVFHNSFIGNTNQAYDDTTYENYWDNGYPSGGNYWDDYSGLDTKNGPNQDITGGDGIGDSPYEIELDSLDNYPLMEPWGTDTTPPSIELISPLNESFIDIGIIINLSISDINLDEVTFSINNGGNEILTSPYIIETSDWLDGDYTVEVQATDTSDNVKTVVYHFYVDTIPPTISLDSPRNNSIINADSLIEFTISDDNIEDVTYRINEGISIPLSHPFIINPSDWSEGDNTITILAIDKAGNTNERWYRFTLDRSAPQIILNSPENGSFIKDLSLDFDISDDNLDSVQYKKNQDTFIDFEVPYDLDITFWEDGEYTITIKVSDLAGNTMENWFIFQKDTTSPEIVSIYPEDDSMDVGVNEKIVIEFSEPMDLQSVESAISISPYSEYSCAWRSDNTSLTLSFSESLEYQTQYKLTIGSASQDLASNTMNSKSEHEFTTVEQSENGIAEFPLFNFILLILIILTIVGLFVMVVLLIKRKKNIQKISEVGPQFQDQSMEIACPQCGYYFMVSKTYGPMQIQCPNCGTQGTLR